MVVGLSFVSRTQQGGPWRSRRGGEVTLLVGRSPGPVNQQVELPFCGEGGRSPEHMRWGSGRSPSCVVRGATGLPLDAGVELAYHARLRGYGVGDTSLWGWGGMTGTITTRQGT